MQDKKNFLKLLKQDSRLYDFYQQYGLPDPRPQITGFWGLVRIVNAQLISTTAANTILKRLDSVLDDHTAHTWYSADKEKIRACGMSHTKIATLNTVAGDILNHRLDLHILCKQPPDTIHKTLTAYKGIGNWTANAYALMHHPDVFLYDDLGIRDGVQIVLDLNDRPSSAFCKQHYEQNWHPYGTSATYFIWHVKHCIQNNLNI